MIFIHCEAHALAPTHVHAQQHLGPILAVDATGTGDAHPGAYVVRHGRFEGFVQIGAPSDEDVAGIAVQVAKRVLRTTRGHPMGRRET